MLDEDDRQKTDREMLNRNDQEYILKGVQAFSVGIALFAASVAVAHAAISQMQSDLPLAIRIAQLMLLLLLNIAISTFGCTGVLLGLSMTGFVEFKGPIKIFDWGITSTWIVLAFVFAGVASTVT